MPIPAPTRLKGWLAPSGIAEGMARVDSTGGPGLGRDAPTPSDSARLTVYPCPVALVYDKLDLQRNVISCMPGSIILQDRRKLDGCGIAKEWTSVRPRTCQTKCQVCYDAQVDPIHRKKGRSEERPHRTGPPLNGQERSRFDILQSLARNLLALSDQRFPLFAESRERPCSSSNLLELLTSSTWGWLPYLPEASR